MTNNTYINREVLQMLEKDLSFKFLENEIIFDKLI